MRRASSDEVTRVAEVLKRAFAGEPIQRWCMACDDPVELIGLEFLEAARQLAAGGFLWVTEDLSGAAGWFPPGADYDEEAIDAVVSAALVSRGGRAEPRAGFWQWVEDHRPSTRHWYLDLLGVEPERQGTGLGRFLLKEGLARVDALAEAVFLVTDDRHNAAWYERHGFSIQSAERSPENGPMVWFMYRPPRL